MKKVILMCIFSLLLMLTECTKIQDEETTIDITTDPIIFDYLNETPPTNEAQLFGPSGYLSNELWHWHGTPVFSPDGKEMYLTKYIKATNEIEIWFTKESNHIWSEPEKFEIDGITGAYNCPVFASDGNELYFLNLNGMTFSIYKVTRDGNSWKNPEIININIPQNKVLGWSFSVAENKNLYFLLWDIGGLEHQKIYRSIYNNGVYSDPESLDILDIGSDGVGGPSIAPDESYIIFDAVFNNSGFGFHDLYVSFKNDLGEFTAPINLGNQVNTNQEDAGATISVDGLYLFYTTIKTTDLGYNPYWIKISELEAFK